MKRRIAKQLLGMVVIALGAHGNAVRADPVQPIHTMSDWTGENNFTGANNYSVISPTSAGGQFQSRVNFDNTPSQSHQYYLSDPSLSVPLTFTDELHMTGTVTFSAPIDNAHNWFFGWYNSSDTRFRIGLILRAPTSEDHWIRWTSGYAATGVLGGNLFRSPTADGTQALENHNADLPDGTYPFTFDYVPGYFGTMKATIGDHYYDFGPVPRLAELPFSVPLDRFGFVQRATSAPDPTISFNLVVENITYTGGSPVVPEPSSLSLAGLGTIGLCVTARRCLRHVPRS